jgi:hypothetical protein
METTQNTPKSSFQLHFRTRDMAHLQAGRVFGSIETATKAALKNRANGIYTEIRDRRTGERVG